jgi:hypothetical protein
MSSEKNTITMESAYHLPSHGFDCHSFVGPDQFAKTNNGFDLHVGHFPSDGIDRHQFLSPDWLPRRAI